MSNLIINRNKIIIDGHSNDIETCNTLTNICDELAKSDKFNTIKYESGYGEFESIVENEDKKFADSTGDPLYIYSNDGTTVLLQQGSVPSSYTVEVQDSGLVVRASGSDVSFSYTYEGSKKFIGIATSANSTEPTYKIGDTFVISDSGFYLYIVEADPSFQVTIKSKDGSTTLSQNSTVDSVVVTSTGAILSCSSEIKETYIHSGTNIYRGLSISSGATSPTYAIDSTIPITADTIFYIAEKENIELLTNTGELISIADAIRTKSGKSEEIVYPSGFISEISELGIIEISTEEEMSALLVAENVGKVYKYTGATGKYTNGDFYEVCVKG